MALLKPCRRCSRVMIPYEESYCEDCKKIVEQEEKERWAKRKQQYYKEYDMKRKDKEYHSLYKTTRWQKLRRKMLVDCLGLCKLTVLMTETILPPDNSPLILHHINPAKEIGQSNFYKEDNLIVVCEHFHELIHLAYDCGKEELKDYLKQLKRIPMQSILVNIIDKRITNEYLEIMELKEKIQEILEEVE